MDHDNFSRDDPLGDVWIGLERLREADHIVVNEMPLDAPNDKLPATGVISFEVFWDAPASAYAVAPRKRFVGEERLGSSGILRVHMERGIGLTPKDWNGRSDPCAPRLARLAHSLKPGPAFTAATTAVSSRGCGRGRPAGECCGCCGRPRRGSKNCTPAPLTRYARFGGGEQMSSCA